MNLFRRWTAIGVLVLSSSVGDVMLSAAMKRVGDLDALRSRHGLLAVVVRVLKQKFFVLGLICLTFSFFCLLTALSWGDVSLVAPASASLTFICSIVLAKFFLKERVDHRRWIAAALVCIGVALLAQ